MKYDWKQLEKEYILGDYKSVKEFLDNKEIKYNGNARDKTKGWTEKRVTKQEQKSNKTVEKIIEKESEKEAEKIIQVKDVAIELIKKISDSTNKIQELKEIKQLTSALKDLNDIIGENNTPPDTEKDNMEQLTVEELKAIAYANINANNNK